ncbi:hemerythrin domain-containing protein [Allosphingosinicella indica]|uniref:hemerythrin domain-containing protein n=1 Tax=Allosphingosinicella indica TaxID=941907 RepID=UPI0015614055|nr:hemerythrin domain-containing protein [Allosphingosinicella indica]
MPPPTLPFRREHRLIDQAARQLRMVVAQGKPPDPSILFALRQRFSALLTAHLNGEDWMMYPRIRAGQDARAAAVADRFVAEMGALSRDYAAYDRQWTGTAAAADWPAFRAATSAILDALAIRIAREEEELYPLLDVLASCVSAPDASAAARSVRPSRQAGTACGAAARQAPPPS